MTDLKCSFSFSRRSRRLLLCLPALAIIGCGTHHNTAPVLAHSSAQTQPSILARSPATTQAVASTIPVKTYDNCTAGIELCYPADWQPEKAQTACFAVAAPAGPTPGSCSLSLDVPKMPWHIKNMIPMAVVAHDYVSDVQKDQITDAVVQEEQTIAVPDANARRIICSGHENGKVCIDVAVILVHADQVYILSADSDEAGKDRARKTIDAAVASLKWTK